MFTRKWTAEEDTVLRASYPVLGPAGCAALFDRTRNAISKRACALGVKWVGENDHACDSSELRSFSSIGHELGISRELARQEYESAIRKLRAGFAKLGISTEEDFTGKWREAS